MEPSEKKGQEGKQSPNWAHTEDSLRDNHALCRHARSADNAPVTITSAEIHRGTANTRHCQAELHLTRNFLGRNQHRTHSTLNRKEVWVIQCPSAKTFLLHIIKIQLPDVLLGVWYVLSDANPWPQLCPQLQFTALHLKASQVLTRERNTSSTPYPQTLQGL